MRAKHGDQQLGFLTSKFLNIGVVGATDVEIVSHMQKLPGIEICGQSAKENCRSVCYDPSTKISINMWYMILIINQINA